MAAAWRPPEGLVLDGRERGGRLCHAGEKAIITAIDPSCFHFPCPLQRSGSGSGKSIKNRALGLIRKRDPAHRISTGIAVAIPPGYYGRLAPRSGLAFKHGIDVLAGVIDSDYTGELKVMLFNSDNTELVIKPGDRVVQLILERADKLPVEEVDELDDTARGGVNGGDNVGQCGGAKSSQFVL